MVLPPTVCQATSIHSKRRKMAELFNSVFYYWIFSAIISLVSAQTSSSRISLQTEHGLIIGTRELVDRDRSRREYYAFTGIPYAKAPVGERRWQPAELLEIAPGTVHATSYGPPCPQYDGSSDTLVGSENCLMLNVFTPFVPGVVVPVGGKTSGGRGGVPLSNARPLLPVIVYFHGGGYVSGSSDMIGARRFMRHDVVLVTVNYRLGVLGYLSTEDEVISGNYGALDQITALNWVQKYIRGMGGNPARITIMGHSSGAASVHLLMLSPRALGLFHAAIIQSGNAFCDWAVNENPRQVAQQIGEYLGCDTYDSTELLDCLREKPVEDLLEAQKSVRRLAFFPLKFTPVIDGPWMGENAFLFDAPKAQMHAGAFAQVPVITGVVHHEGLQAYARIHVEAGEKFRDPDYIENVLLPELLENTMDSVDPIQVTVDAIKTQYLEAIHVANDTKQVITELVQILGDQQFYSCHWDMLETFAEDSKSNVYSYVFSHKTPSSPSIASMEMRKIRQMGIHHPLFNYGISHGDELFYLFDIKGHSAERMSAEDERVSDIITRAWVSFATTGSPASGLQLIPNAVPWRPIKPGNINYYNITTLPSPMGEDFRKGEALFWLRTVPYIQQLGGTITDLEDYPMYFWIALGIAIFLFLLTLILCCLLWKAKTY